MTRLGTVCLLGAGASADAGYPLAAHLRPQFVELVKAAAQCELQHRREVAEKMSEIAARMPSQSGGNTGGEAVYQTEPDLDAPTIEDTFNYLWTVYEECAANEKLLAIPTIKDGEPKLGSAVRETASGMSFASYILPRESEDIVPTTIEGFFGFYDLLERPILRSLYNKLPVPEGIANAPVKPQDFRDLRKIALRATYEALAPIKHKKVDYLAPLLSILGPFGHPVLASLNFDLAIERIAADSGLNLFDGFCDTPRPDLSRPKVFDEAEAPNLTRLWDAAHSNLCPYKGFNSVPSVGVELLKLHGSLGWYSIEEGSGDIANRSDLRQNSVYAHMRLPLDVMACAGKDGNLQDLAVGGPSDLAMQSVDGIVSRKAGVIWLRPNLVFARATKMHSDALWIDLLGRFSLALACAQNVLVVGYSWGDVHINDMLLNAVAQGITLIDVSGECPSQHTLGLIAQRIPTTFRETSSRIYMFGGGTKCVFSERKVVLSSGEMADFDLPDALMREISIPAEYSLRHTIS